MRRYILELTKNLGLLIGGITIGFILVFVIVDICMGGTGEMPFALFIGLAVGLLWFLVLIAQAIPFARMIRRQEQEGLVLDDEVQLVDRGIVGTYLGDAWLIHAGHVALHHSRIASVKEIHTGRGSAASMCYIRVETVDGRRYRWAMGSGAVRKVRDWLRERKSELPEEEK